MIIPWLRGFLKWDEAPITWALVFTNIFVFFLTYQTEKPSSVFNTSEKIEMSGRLYDQYKNLTFESKTKDQYLLLGSLALRDPEFLGQAKDFNFAGDAVAIESWRAEVEKFTTQLQQRNSHLFGLLTDQSRPLTWITYQFMHAGWIHLISNMLLFIIFGAAIESLYGGVWLIVIFLLSGFAGGLGFLWLGGHSLAPMVGASGAISGVMAFYAMIENKKRVAFFYFISPIQDYYGLIYLPTYLIFPLCFVTDFANYFSTPDELGNGVAFTAHMGGAIFGVLVGLLMVLIKKLSHSSKINSATIIKHH